MQTAKNILFIIPAYNPTIDLVDIVKTITETESYRILIVDDGSDSREIFRRIEDNPNVEILTHSVNMGKGRALKTAFSHAVNSYKAINSVITMDADGQHLPEDALKICFHSLRNPDRLILGSRQLNTSSVPFRSRIGNVVSSKVFSFLLGRKIHDTQTGLRAIPIGFCRNILNLNSNGFGFELQMLIEAYKRGVMIEEQFIQTIYSNNNASSSFRPVADTIKIIFIFLSFTMFLIKQKLKNKKKVK